VAWLIEEGYDVVCFICLAKRRDFTAARQKALKIGAKKCYIEDQRRVFE
jgi:argininosuccinate synthase